MDQKNEQDLTVGLDGAMTEGATSTPPMQDVGTDSQTLASPTVASEPTVNSIAPPPIDEKIQPPEVEDAPLHDPSSGVVQAPEDDNSDQSPEKVTHTRDTKSESETTGNEVGTTNDKYDDAQEFSQTSQNTATQHRAHEHRNNKKLAVFMTVLVALLLSAAAVFVYVSAQDNATPQQPVPESVVTPSSTLPAEEELNNSSDESIELLLSDTEDQTSENDPTEDAPAPSSVSEQTVQEPVQ